jgi:uncharacterized membrane protein
MKYILDECRAINGAHIQNIIENKTNTLLFLSKIILFYLIIFYKYLNLKYWHSFVESVDSPGGRKAKLCSTVVIK